MKNFRRLFCTFTSVHALVCALIATTAIALPAKALVNGTVDTSMNAVVLLTAEMSETQIQTPEGPAITSHVQRCTGVVVGLNPITLITARHCVFHALGIYLGSTLDWPADQIFQSEYGTQVFDDQDHVPGDITVLTFKGDPSLLPSPIDPNRDVFTVEPMPLALAETISICGFGLTTNSTKTGTPDGNRRCGQNFLEIENPSFQTLDFLSAAARLGPGVSVDDTKLINDREKIEYFHFEIQKSLAEYGAHTRIGIGPFDQNDFDLQKRSQYQINQTPTLINEGDSGGPWFLDDTSGIHHLIGITSFAGWTSQSILAFGMAWRLDYAWSKSFLQQAAAHGADIRGLAKLLAMP
jgi:hypothetical protein